MIDSRVPVLRGSKPPRGRAKGESLMTGFVQDIERLAVHRTRAAADAAAEHFDGRTTESGEEAGS
jgi:hypothetical protein